MQFRSRQASNRKRDQFRAGTDFDILKLYKILISVQSQKGFQVPTALYIKRRNIRAKAKRKGFERITRII
ncbi:hypothetical protein LguiB_024017 [Lonicera macranthoides]